MANSEPTVKDGSKSPLLWGLPEHLSRDLFKGATSVRLSVDQILFHAGDAGDGCYRVDDGLAKQHPSDKLAETWALADAIANSRNLGLQ